MEAQTAGPSPGELTDCSNKEREALGGPWSTVRRCRRREAVAGKAAVAETRQAQGFVQEFLIRLLS